MSTAIASLVDGAIVIALALLATVVLRRRSAAIRHATLVTGVIAALAMPAFELALPLIPVVERAAPVYATTDAALVPDASVSAAISEAQAVGRTGISWFEIAVAVWAAGAIVILVGLATSMIRLARLRARTTPVDGAWRELTDELSSRAGIRRPIALLQTADPSLLVTCGILRPAILLPAGASSWPHDRIRNVLRHELAHLARRDAAIQTVTEVFRALHWVNPLAWIVCRRLRQESEFACDDAVLSAGVKPEDYAADLLAIARQLSPGNHWVSAHAMAHPSTLERRIAAMLQGNNRRAALRRRAWISAAILALGISVPIAAAGIADAAPIEVAGAPDGLLPAGAAVPAPVSTQQTPPSPPRPVVRQPAASIGGTILDQSGGAMPGVRVTLTEVATRKQLTTNTNAEGRFVFRDLAEGRYELTGRLPGFATITSNVTFKAGTSVQPSYKMGLGTLRETLTVQCGGWLARLTRSVNDAVVPVLSAQERPRAPIRVGGSVRAPQKTRDVKPVCPSDAPAGEFTIQLTGQINKEGAVQKLALDTSAAQPPASLVDASLNAVRQWIFTPTLLNGVPIDVDIAVRIVFTRK